VDEPAITLDKIEVAQFIHLMRVNPKISDVIDATTSKAVLILGPFTPPERKVVLDAMRDELRKRDYLPIVFDFEVPARRNITETVTLLAAGIAITFTRRRTSSAASAGSRSN
jgi:hypothetical protein